MTLEATPALSQQNSILADELKRRYRLRLTYAVTGSGCLILGILMSIMGYAGNIDFDLHMSTVFQARLGNAGPGLVIAVLGVAHSCIAATGFKIESNFRAGEAASEFAAYGRRLPN